MVKRSESQVAAEIQRLQALRQSVHDFRSAQNRFRERLQHYMDDKGYRTNDLAHELETGWKGVKTFLDGTTTLAVAHVEQFLCGLGEEVLAREIVRTAKLVPDRERVLAVLPAETIDLVFELRRARMETVGRLLLEEFCSRFGKHAKVVHEVIRKNGGPVLFSLGDPVLAQEVRVIIQLENWKSISREDCADGDAAKHVAQLNALLDRLVVQYQSKSAVAKRLGHARTGVQMARTGNSSTPFVLKLIAKAEKLLREPMAKEEAGKVSILPPTQQPTKKNTDPMTELKALDARLRQRYGSQKKLAVALQIAPRTYQYVLAGKRDQERLCATLEKMRKLVEGQLPELVPSPGVSASEPETLPEVFGGSTSPNGTRWVISARNFQDIPGLIDPDFVQMVKQRIAGTRALLNIVTQHTDGRNVDVVQKQLGPEVDELFLSIRVFSGKIPCQVAEYADAEREFWSAMPPANPSSQKRTRTQPSMQTERKRS